MPVLPPSDAANTRSGYSCASAPKQQSTRAEPGQAARGAGGRQLAVGDRARRRDHLDRAEHAVVVRHVDRQHRLHRGEARRGGVAPGVVDRAFHLRRAAGPVHLHRVAALAHGADQRDRLADVDLVVVDPVGERRLAVRQFGQAVPGQAFGIVHRRDHQRAHARRRRSARPDRPCRARRSRRRRAGCGCRRTRGPARARCARSCGTAWRWACRARRASAAGCAAPRRRSRCCRRRWSPARGRRHRCGGRSSRHRRSTRPSANSGLKMKMSGRCMPPS